MSMGGHSDVVGTAGPGGDTSGRIPLEHFLSRKDVRNFTIEKVFLERPKWIDRDYVL